MLLGQPKKPRDTPRVQRQGTRTRDKGVRDRGQAPGTNKGPGTRDQSAWSLDQGLGPRTRDLDEGPRTETRDQGRNQGQETKDQ